ncbi:hypothetical protein BYT27DRAFT_7247795 [Phlegmacium glaucopus]|nr:hypothetical protein BYT27DRAFT_7247795 [Phlegmacium glaucopus]
MDLIAKSISTATNQVRIKLEEALEQLTTTTLTVFNLVEELHEECHGIFTGLKETISSYTAAGEGRTGEQDKGRWVEYEGLGKETRDTYATRARKVVPVAHASAIMKAELQNRRVRLRRAEANIAIQLMDKQVEFKPAGTKFMGANRVGGPGDILYEMNLVEAAEWIRGKEVMELFIKKMGSILDYRELTYKVVLDWVPTTFNVDQKSEWATIELASGLEEGAIREAKWIKPIHLRAQGQCTAIAIFGFATW